VSGAGDRDHLDAALAEFKFAKVAAIGQAPHSAGISPADRKARYLTQRVFRLEM
jgi:hypothetical protein